MANPYDKQVSNRNFLSPVGFKFTLDRAKKVSFLGNSANIPGLTLGVANQATPLKDIDTPGDKILFDDFTLRFLVDENLENYLEVYNWIRGLGYPESLQEIIDFQRTGKVDKNPYGKEMDIYSDGTLIIQTSNFVPNFQIKFRDLWPYSLTTLNFDATDNDIQYFTADVTFKYTIFDITDLSGKPL
tara:strand:+ start:443 stop:1000 length:558 start_codon:yes stop_codon:yes gene_type:complete